MSEITARVVLIGIERTKVIGAASKRAEGASTDKTSELVAAKTLGE